MTDLVPTDQIEQILAARLADAEARTEAAAAKVARVEALLARAGRSDRHINGYSYVLLRTLDAALRGDQ